MRPADYVHVTDSTINGQCSQCGQCCSDMLPMSDEEVERIRKYVRKHCIREQRHNACAGFDLTCPFRDERRKICTVYEVRPEICKAFMCSHTVEDIRRAKIDFHRSRRVVMMRKEFFGSTEDEDLFKAYVAAIRKAAAGK